VLINPTNARNAESTLRDVPEAARAIGLQTQILNAGTSREIEAAVAAKALDRADALFVAPDGFFNARRVQFATLATHHWIPAAYASREQAEAGALTSYGPMFWACIVKSGSTPACPVVRRETEEQAR
jgi:putative tryptophan/tyrosine transport system substrate-binding protein